MSGNQEFQQIVAQAPRKKLKFLSSSIATPLGIGLTENVDFYSATGTISRVVAFYFYVPKAAGATTGTHQLDFLNGTAGGHIISGSSLPTDDLLFDYSVWTTATGVKKPGTDEAVGNAVRNTYFDSTLPLRIAYFNNLNVVQPNARSIILTVEETTLG